MVMAGRSAVIRKYHRKLAPELGRRYGGSGPWTLAQVDATVRELKLNDRFIRYAYLMYCEREVLAREQLPESDIARMHDTVAAAVGGGLAVAPLDVVFGGVDGDAGGLGGGFGGEGGLS